jgi:hypothetical protein
LPIHIRDANFVEINQCDFPDSASGKCLCGPRTYSTDTDHSDVSGSQFTQFLLSIESGEAGKAI